MEQQVDTNRLWYIYSQDKELGPFKEVELRHRLLTGNIPGTAHAFTEGMPDWKPIQEIEGLKELLEKQEVPAVANLAEAMDQIPFSKKFAIKKWDKSRIFLSLSITICVLATLGYFWDPLKEGAPAPKTNEIVAQNYPHIEGEKDPFAARDWAELKNYRSRTDIVGSGFVLSKDQIDEEFPVLKGAVSSNVSSNEIEFRIYPVPGAHLMPLPKVLEGRTSVVNGYFVIGPLSDAGSSLPLGKYRIIAKAGTTYLGELTLLRGHLPEGELLQQAEEGLSSSRMQKIADLRTTLIQRVTGLTEILKDFESLKLGALSPGATAPTDYAPKARLALEKFRDLRTAVKSTEGDLLLWGTGGIALYQFVENIWSPLSTAFQEFPNPNPDRFASLKVKDLLNELGQIKSKIEKTKSEEISQRSLDLLNEDVIKKAFMNEESAAR